jgi:2-polyprenyl-6-methoxyphenol hydroxylase-like FAD-dependent oxidoreductase
MGQPEQIPTMELNVLICDGGVAGLTVAYWLMRAGIRPLLRFVACDKLSLPDYPWPNNRELGLRDSRLQ